MTEQMVEALAVLNIFIFGFFMGAGVLAYVTGIWKL
jgi:hypothetical protein